MKLKSGCKIAQKSHSTKTFAEGADRFYILILLKLMTQVTAYLWLKLIKFWKFIGDSQMFYVLKTVFVK
jgi:hypothetical protein